MHLCRPRIAVLQILSAFCGYFAAAAGALHWLDLLWLGLGGFAISGSASIINSIWERDIDQLMERTKDRGLGDGRVPLVSAWIAGLGLGALGYAVLTWGLNPLAGFIGLSGHVFYLAVYTMWLKRTSPYNIVIGGAAGAVPPLSGWAAATGSLGTTAWLMFLLIFMWTPPHFWALAMLKIDDYKRAGVPMMPVVRGERETVKHMLFYAASLIPIGVCIALSSDRLSTISLALLTALGVMFLYRVWKLKQSLEGSLLPRKAMSKAFQGSIAYLGGFFVILMVDLLS